MSRLRDWADLCRLPNVFTAMADPLAGALIVGATWRRSDSIAALMLASACLYAGGMALNDWNDLKRDREQRPQRPLPSGRIGKWSALLAAIVMLAGGGLLTTIPGRTTGYVGALLVAAIVAYDVVLKDIPIAPAVMGICRSLNLLLGMTLVPAAASPVDASVRVFLAAVAGVYVLGVTLFARREAATPNARQLVIGSLVTWLPLIAVALAALLFPDRGLHLTGKIWIAVLLLIVAYRMVQAILTPKPETVQQAVKAAVLGIILLDAGMAAFARGFWVSLLVVVLLAPALVLGRSLQST